MIKKTQIKGHDNHNEGLLQNIFTPANYTTIIGLAVTIWGSFMLNTVYGLVAVTAGRLLDMLDGIIARHTRSSKFGASLDAFSDKIAGFSFAMGIIYYQLAPVLLIFLLLGQHLVIAVLALEGFRRKQRLIVTQNGKNNMFLFMITLIAFTALNLVSGITFTLLHLVSYILAAGSVLYGFYTFVGYVRQLQRNKS